jgi:hypothetical protein
MLYNPFVALVHTANGLSVQHLCSNRATVGSGELQDFSPVQKFLAKVVSPTEYLVCLVPAPTIIFPIATDTDTDKTFRYDFASNLWFRPPPSA